MGRARVSFPADPQWFETLRQLANSEDLDAFAEATAEWVALIIQEVADAAVEQHLGQCGGQQQAGDLDAISEAIAARVAPAVQGMFKPVEQRWEGELHAMKGELDAVKLRMDGLEQRYEQRCRQGGGQQQAGAAQGLAAAAAVGGEGVRAGGSQAVAAASAGGPLSAGAGAGRAKTPRRPACRYISLGLPKISVIGSYAALWRLWKHGSGRRSGPLQEVVERAEERKVALQPALRWGKFASVARELERRAALETYQGGHGQPVGGAGIADMLDAAIRKPDGKLRAFSSSVDALLAARNKRPRINC